MILEEVLYKKKDWYRDASPLKPLKKRLKLVDTLLKFGADAILKDTEGITPLMIAAGNNEVDYDVVKRLLEIKSVRDRIDERSNYGSNVLHYAVAKKNNEFTGVLNTVFFICFLRRRNSEMLLKRVSFQLPGKIWLDLIEYKKAPLIPCIGTNDN